MLGSPSPLLQFWAKLNRAFQVPTVGSQTGVCAKHLFSDFRVSQLGGGELFPGLDRSPTHQTPDPQTHLWSDLLFILQNFPRKPPWWELQISLHPPAESHLCVPATGDGERVYHQLASWSLTPAPRIRRERRDGRRVGWYQGWAGNRAAWRLTWGQTHRGGAVGVVSTGVRGLWVSSAAPSASSYRSESRSWPGWLLARWPGGQSSRIRNTCSGW